MTRQLLVLYPEPADRAAFEQHYRDVHLPLCAQLPGVRDISFAIAIDRSPYFAVFSAAFDDAEALQAALDSPEGRAVAADVPRYATGGATVIDFPVETLDDE
ncbi:EthD family reductase [Leucobacter chromiiresistens]|uniref:Ethyl tert-butyl ether degradation protein EthD n=1 Tax=Leucobacter chromiiresistens TaxID=1079994 RepID=A0A147ERY2_9MICO|nr:EthD family reductase [Leucobacter chromiiresistens]KTR87195.1 ethyl tert-butyl ether degradation protein EthD [Leucobacter chromiiresistens]